MKRRTLDYIFSAGGILMATLLVVLGVVLSSQASFARSYVKEQLTDQKITFASEGRLTEEDTTWKAGSTCLAEYAGQQVQTGKQAECYANYYIAMHMAHSAERAGWPGETYATMGGISRGLTADVAAAEAAGDEALAAELQGEYEAAASLRDTFKTGETLRGLLLTTYGFSVFGEKAAIAATTAYMVGSLLAVLSIAGFTHAFLTPEGKLVGTPRAEATAHRHSQAA